MKLQEGLSCTLQCLCIKSKLLCQVIIHIHLLFSININRKLVYPLSLKVQSTSHPHLLLSLIQTQKPPHQTPQSQHLSDSQLQILSVLSRVPPSNILSKQTCNQLNILSIIVFKKKKIHATSQPQNPKASITSREPNKGETARTGASLH
ncbi:unnamed protein product [Ilex paraguariensis]|uniref:Uncharacterized protein n=1 Tax=Ilex paraguariensis TaxID=185542 RepID=A0ABC8SVV8_9AQUA